MENNNNTNNDYSRNKITTTGVTLFDKEATMLKLGFIDDKLSIVLGMPIQNPETGKNMYPTDNRKSFLVTIDRVGALYDIIIKGVLPALENGEEFCKGVFLNVKKNSILQIRVQEGEIYLLLYTDIDENRVTNNSYVFHFQKTDTIANYNNIDGSFTEQESVEGYFYVFCKYVESALYALPGAPGHSNRKTNSYTVNSIFNHLRSIMTKLGITYDGNNSYKKPNKDSGFVDVPEEVPGDELPFGDDIPDISNEGQQLDSLLS